LSLKLQSVNATQQAAGTDRRGGSATDRHERRYDVSHNVSDKIKKAADHAKKAVDRQDDRLEQTSKKVEPYLDEARVRLAEAEENPKHKRH
jgi:hypothetical protein